MTLFIAFLRGKVLMPKVPMMAWLLTKLGIVKYVIVTIVVSCLCAIPLAAQPFTFDVDSEKNELKITTSKRLHYGILPQSSLYNSDNTQREPDFGTLFGITKMVNAQSGFFNLSALGTDKSITKSETTFTLKDTTNTGIGYQSNPGDIEAYLLYTEFDRLSLPAVLNYLTGANIAFALLTKDSSFGKHVNDKAKNFLKNIKEGIEDYKNIAADTVEIVSMINSLVKDILVLADVPEDHEYQVAINSLDSTIDNINVLLKGINAQPTISGDILKKYHFEDGTRQSKVLFNNLQKLLLGVGYKDPSIILESAKKISTDNLLHSAIVVAIFNVILKPVSDDGYFCYPKNVNSYIVDTSGHQCNNSGYERVKINDVAESFVRKYVRGDQVTPEDMKRIKLAAKAVFHTGGRTLFNNIKKFATDTKSLEKATELAGNIATKMVNGILEREVLMQFANSLFEWAITDLAPDMAKKVTVELTARLASYAVPGSGWARFAVDLADASNTGGAYAYDIFTAPRQVPFTLETHANGITEVFKPFAVNLDKFSYLQYPTGVNTVDPYTNGKYSYESYFLAGNGLIPEGTSFQPWNINNRDATLVANGVAYSYDVRIGDFDNDGEWTLSQVLKEEGNFSNGLYSIEFEVNRYANDNLSVQPEKPFTSPVTGVSNQKGETIDEDYSIDFLGLQLNNTTDYKIRHIKAYSYGNYIYEWVSNNNANGTDYDSIYGETGSSIGFESNTLFYDLDKNDFYYLSFKELIVDTFKAEYGDTFSKNYDTNKGIVHVTPGIYRVKNNIGINTPNNSKATGQTKFEDRQLMFVMANTANGWNDNLLSAQHIIPIHLY